MALDDKITKLKLVLKPNNFYLFFPMLQKGVLVSAKVGCDIRTLLCDQFGLMPDYLTDRINTIFLNGQPVDDVNTALVNDGATLALSAAMPGLVGATFRKGGGLASFRGSITYQGEAEGAEICQDGIITLKLFNILLKEIGPRILERGIRMDGRDLSKFFKLQREELQSIFSQISKDGQDLPPEKIVHTDWIDPQISYTLQFAHDDR